MKRCFSLFLILCLIVSTFSVPVQAVAFVDDALLVGVAAAVAIPAILGGLGIMQSSTAPDVFQRLSNSVLDALPAPFKVASAVTGVTLIKMGQLSDGTLYASREVLDSAIRSFADNKSDYGVTVDSSFRGVPFPQSRNGVVFNYWYIDTAKTLPTFYTCSYPLALYSSDSISSISSKDPYVVGPADLSSRPVIYQYRFIQGSFDYLTTSNFFGLSQPSVVPYSPSFMSDSLELGSVGSSLDDSVYADWNASACVTETDDKYLPIFIPGPGQSINQTTIQQGGATTLPPELLELIGGTIAIPQPIPVPTDPPAETTPEETEPGDIVLPPPDGILEGISGIGGKIEGLGDTISGFLTGIQDKLGAIHDAITHGFSELIDLIKSIPELIAKIWEWLQALGLSIAEFWAALMEILASILSGILAIPGILADAIAALFVPTAGLLDARVDALTAKFAFIPSIIGCGRVILGLFDLSPLPPRIVMDFGLNTTGLNWGGKVVVMDLAFFEPYKGTSDLILSGFLLLAFAWRVFMILPGIISGGAGYAGTVTQIERRVNHDR